MVVVKNAIGTTKSVKCPCGSWICHHENYFSQKHRKCCHCGKKDYILGAHVYKVGCKDRSHYIVPFCNACNKNKNSLDIKEKYLVSAQRRDCCQRKKKSKTPPSKTWCALF